MARIVVADDDVDIRELVEFKLSTLGHDIVAVADGAAAIDACQADTLLKSRRGLAKLIRSATVGDWRNHLSTAHLAVFRDQHADLVRALGYEVY